ncbi:hypothetical protein ES703_28638 [subsurface metagenome]
MWVGYPVGRRDDDLIAFIYHCLKKMVKGAFSTGGDDDFIPGIGKPEVLVKPFDDRILEFRDTLDGRVFSEVFFNRLNTGFFDVVRSEKIRLSDTEVHDIDSLGLHGLGLGGYLKSWRCADLTRFF